MDGDNSGNRPSGQSPPRPTSLRPVCIPLGGSRSYLGRAGAVAWVARSVLSAVSNTDQIQSLFAAAIYFLSVNINYFLPSPSFLQGSYTFLFVLKGGTLYAVWEGRYAPVPGRAGLNRAEPRPARSFRPPLLCNSFSRVRAQDISLNEEFLRFLCERRGFKASCRLPGPRPTRGEVNLLSKPDQFHAGGGGAMTAKVKHNTL